MLVDYVFPYVNSSDPIWQQTYSKFCKDNDIKENQFGNESARFRDFGSLIRFVFRSISKNMPFINNIFFIVQSESQVPEWLDKSKVKIIYHDQFIPPRYLPTYNSTTIEMFLWNIPELSEHFIYGNDDLFALNLCEITDFYNDAGLPKIHLNLKSKTYNISAFRKTVINGQNLILSDFPNKAPDKDVFYKTNHLMSPLLKSTVKQVWNKHKIDICNNISPFRTDKNVNQYIYSFYQVFSGQYIDEKFNGKYMDTKGCVINDICDCLLDSTYKVICINDSGLENEKNSIKLYNTLNSIFSEKCKYEYTDSDNTSTIQYNINDNLSKYGFKKSNIEIAEIKKDNFSIKFIESHKYPWVINIENLDYSECFSDLDAIKNSLINIKNKFSPIFDVINDLKNTNILNSANNLNLVYDNFTISKDNNIISINMENKKYSLDNLYLANDTIIEIRNILDVIII